MDFHLILINVILVLASIWETNAASLVKTRIQKPSCQQSGKDTFCNSVRNYPVNFIKSKLKIPAKDFVAMFGGDYTEGQRPALRDDGRRICKSINEIYFPKAASNIKNEWKYIVNVDDYVQGIQIEKCRVEGGDCEEIKENLPFGHHSECKQLYLTRSLMSIKPGDEQLQVDRFKMPSACVCYLQTSSDFFGKNPPLRLFPSRRPSSVRDRQESSIRSGSRLPV